GQKAELWCDGGEAAFLARMIQESQQFADQVGWFSSLVSKADNLPAAKAQLKRLQAEVREIPMHQGNKITRILAWRFVFKEPHAPHQP
ncbi:MAG: RlmF-related methyltransferase, partial [Aeromonas sp.]